VNVRKLPTDLDVAFDGGKKSVAVMRRNKIEKPAHRILAKPLSRKIYAEFAAKFLENCLNSILI
jgi:hypothetical protein